jgi:sugar phosphate permease
MATVQLAAMDRAETRRAGVADGFCTTSAMFGGAVGALAGTSAVAGSFEYATVLVGTFGVVLGSSIAGAAGHYVLLPMYRTLTGRPG